MAQQVALTRPGDKFWAYCVTCETTTSWEYIDVRGGARCTEH